MVYDDAADPRWKLVKQIEMVRCFVDHRGMDLMPKCCCDAVDHESCVFSQCYQNAANFSWMRFRDKRISR